MVAHLQLSFQYISIQLFSSIDRTGNGLIDFNEFVTLMETRAQRVSEDAEMRAYFAAFDKDHNGWVPTINHIII